MSAAAIEPTEPCHGATTVASIVFQTSSATPAVNFRPPRSSRLPAPSRPAALALLGIVALWIQNPALAAVEHLYVVSVDDSLTELQVEARFSQPINSVTARARDAGELLSNVQDCDTAKRLRMRNRRMMLPNGGIRCMNYTVDLARAAREERRNLSLLDDNVLVSPSRWMWRPELDGDTTIRVRFDMPDDVQVAVPWQRVTGKQNEYLLGASPESANAPSLFGAFTSREIHVPGATLFVSVPQTEPAIDEHKILNWLRATATDVTLAYGRFPNPAPHVVVMPMSDSRRSRGSAVPFGRVIRDGGEVVELFVNPSRPMDEYMGDWTATHEFSHLMLPYLGSRHRWISEGFAQYYQNVLLARSGAYPEEMAWEKIHAGLERGQRSRPELSPNEAASQGVRGARMKIYWAGAAIALMADVELRSRSNNRESLDVVLERLQTCCLPSERVWTGPELFAKLDTLTSKPVFMKLYKRHAETLGFPDTTAVFEQLGVDLRGGRAQLKRNAPHAELRQSIMQVDVDAARQRRQLAASANHD